jgi:DNA polymerase-1
MIHIDRNISQHNLRSRMILQVHDELLFDMPLEEKDTLSDLVKSAMILGAKEVGIKEVPIVVDIGIGENWLSAH